MTSVVDWRQPENYHINVQTIDEYATSLGVVLVKDIPDWIWGLRIDWAKGFDSSVSFGLVFDKAIEASMHGEAFGNGWEYRAQEGLYICEDARGFCDGHYAKPLYEDPKLGWVTSQDQGYGGRHFKIKMKDGRDATLRGPWHGGAPQGYHEFVHNYTDVHGKCGITFMFGLYVKSELFLGCIKAFAPEMVVVSSQQKGTYQTHAGIKEHRQVIEFAPKDMAIPKVCWPKDYLDGQERYPIRWR